MSPVVHVPFMTLDLAAGGASPGEARHAVATFAAAQGASAEVLERVQLAVTEAVTNAVVHAYADGAGPIQVAADSEDGELEVVVCDNGLGFRSGFSPGAGLGLMVIERCADAFLVRNRMPQGIEVWMRFVLTG